MYDRPAVEGDVLRVAVFAVLRLRLLHILAGERVLQLRRGDGEAVDEEREVQGLVSAGLVGQLPGDGEPVGLVAPDELRRQPVRGLEEGEPQRNAEVHDPVPQHVHRTPRIQLLHEPVCELFPRFRFPAVQFREPVPRLRLRLFDKREELREIQATRRIEVPGGVAALYLAVSATLHERVRDVFLKRPLVRLHPRHRWLFILFVPPPLSVYGQFGAPGSLVEAVIES